MRFDLPAAQRSQLILQTALALTVGLAVYFLWPLTGLGRLGREEVWFGLGWALLLALPSPRGPAEETSAPEADQESQSSFSPRACRSVSLLAGGLFVALLVAGRELGNYKLWLGLVYLGAISLRLAGLSLELRQALPPHPRRDLHLALIMAGLTGLAGLLIIPWARPDLVAFWPPPRGVLRPLAACLLWGGVVGALLLALRQWGLSGRATWLIFLALGLGPGPALAVSWFQLLPLALTFLVLAALSLPRLLRPLPDTATSQPAPEPLPLYWLVRALLLMWWGVGAAFTLALAWWQPRAGALFSESIWLRGVGLGAFLVACAGLLTEYSLPLLGRPEVSVRQRRQGPAQGIILSCLAILAALSPLLLARPPAAETRTAPLPNESRAELLPQTRSLDPAHPEMELKVPGWLSGINRVFVVSLLAHGAEVAQGEAVAQLVATDDQDIPHIFSLRAGVDTSEWALQKREVATSARHAQARPAQSWQVFEPTGEAFQAHIYYTGLFLGSEVHRLKTVTLRYLYQNPPSRQPVVLEVRRVFLN
ncbi:MAG: hypothetical protein V1806_03010 [Pseudomonadota bacterium]